MWSLNGNIEPMREYLRHERRIFGWCEYSGSQGIRNMEYIRWRICQISRNIGYNGIWNITEYGIFGNGWIWEYSNIQERWIFRRVEYMEYSNIQERWIFRRWNIWIFEYSGTLNIREGEYRYIRIFREAEYFGIRNTQVFDITEYWIFESMEYVNIGYSNILVCRTIGRYF